MTMFGRWVAVASLLSTLGCAQSGMEPVYGTVGGLVELRLGQQASFANGTLQVRFRSVPKDSRCPMDAVCVWLGDATVRVVVSGEFSGGALRTIDLHTHEGAREVVLDGWALSLESLLPYPASATQIRQEEYVVTLRVRRTG